MTWSQIIASALTAIATLGAAFLGAWLAPRRYRSERVWDQKLEIFTKIFNAINEMQEEFDALLDEETRDNTFISPEYRSTLVEATAKARVEIRKQSRVGSFIISEAAEKLLRELLSEIDRSGIDKSYFDRIDRNAAVIAATTNKLKTIARRDIKT